MFKALTAVIRRDLLIAFRRRASLMNPLLFYIIIVILFPLGVTPDTGFLSKLAPGVVWVTALLAGLLSMESVFRQDFDDGSIEQLFFSRHPPAVLILGKVAAHWLITGLPMLVVIPVMALLLHVPVQAVPALVTTVLLGTPILSLIAAVGVVLTAGLQGGGVLLGLLVLPLYIPVLIFATSAVSASINGLPYSGQLAFLAAGLILTLMLAPAAIYASLKISIS